MSFYDPQSWQLPGGMRETSWDQQPPPSRSEAEPAVQREEFGAFHNQIEEVDRAIDNLAKSGKLFNQPSRRDSMPMMGGPESFSQNFSPRGGGMGGRHHSIDHDQMRPQSGSGLQNFYANQRHQPRPNEAEQMVQAKRRMAAQRERELRNYHQEQQYNRNVSTKGAANSDRAISPNTINEEDRRELIARQHRALYGNENSPYQEGAGFGDDNHTPRASNPTSGSASVAGFRGPSPRTYDPFSKGQNQGQSNLTESGGQFSSNSNEQNQQSKGPSPKPQQQPQQSSRADSTSSPASNPQSQSFALFETAAQQSSRTSTSSPGGSPPRQGKTSAPGVAPIGTRPAQSQGANLAPNNKRSGTPSLSPLGNGHSFSGNEGLSAPANNNERSTSAASNPTSGGKDSNVSSWGQASSGPWGSNSSKPLGAQASVWG